MALNQDKREYDESGKLINKQCNVCFRMLPINQYYSNAAQYDGYSNTCKECENASLSVRLKNYKRNAKNRKLDFILSKEEFQNISSQTCFYCGEFGSTSPTGERYNGIDRIDSSLGYTLDNIVPCCSTCNRMKMDISQDDFLKQVYKITQYRVSKGAGI